MKIILDDPIGKNYVVEINNINIDLGIMITYWSFNKHKNAKQMLKNLESTLLSCAAKVKATYTLMQD